MHIHCNVKIYMPLEFDKFEKYVDFYEKRRTLDEFKWKLKQYKMKKMNI